MPQKVFLDILLYFFVAGASLLATEVISVHTENSVSDFFDTVNVHVITQNLHDASACWALPVLIIFCLPDFILRSWWYGTVETVY